MLVALSGVWAHATRHWGGDPGRGWGAERAMEKQTTPCWVSAQPQGQSRRGKCEKDGLVEGELSEEGRDRTDRERGSVSPDARNSGEMCWENSKPGWVEGWSITGRMSMPWCQHLRKFMGQRHKSVLKDNIFNSLSGKPAGC